MSILKSLKEAASLTDLAAVLGYKPSAVAYILYKLPVAQKYKKFTIHKSDGGERHICAPNERLKTLQRRLANVLYACRHEIDASSGLRPMSHGFRRKHSIITNARRHKRRRYVLNLDIKNFFIHNNNFKLNDKVATIIAQIACFENALPQGSPCSPIIADLIAHLLDVRLVGLAKQHNVTYSRYADDLTFSTSRRDFPTAIATPVAPESPHWNLGSELLTAMEKIGFPVNSSKTRMQFRMSRQLVTGLTVNAKVNIRREYYGSARVMCHTLFKRGTYYRPAGADVANDDASGIEKAEPELIDSLGPLEGILSHIHHVKDTIDDREEPDKRKHPTAAQTVCPVSQISLFRPS